jgi:PAS domain-containing protein
MERTDFDQWKAKEVARLLALVESERRYYQEMVAGLPLPLVVVSTGKSVIWANRAFRRMFELRVEDLRRKDIEQLLPVAGLGDWLREVHAGGKPAPLSAGLGLDTFRISAVPMPNWDDEADAETLLMIEQASGAGPKPSFAPAARQQPAPSLPADLPAIVWQADADTLRFRSVSGAAEQMLGYRVSHWLTRPEFFEERIHPDDRAATLTLFLATASQGGEASAEYRAVGRSGEVVW